ncbi:leucine-rich repeat domain-containing protein [Psychroserpens sp. MEBiC05023]
MNKILPIIGVLTMICFQINAQNVNIPDANFKAYLVGNSAINTNGDTEIQVSEASIFSGAIYCGNSSISDLTGIESFTNLTTLRCQGNSLTTLDISNNTNLIELNCSNNALSTLDLTNNTDLTQLSCSSNSLTTLDVSNHSALTFIDCGANAITSIDLSNNPALTTFGCNFNSTLMTLDLSNNSVLTEMYCNNTPITALNVANGNNTIITTFAATNTPNLTCIQVDDVNYSTTNWTNIDPASSFSLDCGTLGINDLKLSKNISLYPNPAQSQIQLNSNETIKFVSIIDIFGKTIKVNLTITSGINISDLSNGVYFLRIYTDKGIAIKKFIKD